MKGKTTAPFDVLYIKHSLVLSRAEPQDHLQKESTMSYPTLGSTNISNGVTTVDCQKQVRSWRLLRSLLELLIPTCSCISLEEPRSTQEQNYIHSYLYSRPTLLSSTVVTGTLFGYRLGKVRFCIQTNSGSTNPILLLELAVPTAILAREMQGGILRITLESAAAKNGLDSNTLLSIPVWTMCCNGRKVGLAVKRTPSKVDMDVLGVMAPVIVGAGIISAEVLNSKDELLYLRANFERVRSSSDSESFHLIDPDGNMGQELGIFFLRSR